jgi:hypothetical protein
MLYTIYIYYIYMLYIYYIYISYHIIRVCRHLCGHHDAIRTAPQGGIQKHRAAGPRYHEDMTSLTKVVNMGE